MLGPSESFIRHVYTSAFYSRMTKCGWSANGCPICWVSYVMFRWVVFVYCFSPTGFVPFLLAKFALCIFDLFAGWSVVWFVRSWFVFACVAYVHQHKCSSLNCIHLLESGRWAVGSPISFIVWFFDCLFFVGLG